MTNDMAGLPVSFAVLVIAYLFHPFNVLPLERLGDSNVRHASRCARAMPMLYPRRSPDDIARLNLLLFSTLLLYPTGAGGHNQELSERMRMPCSARTGLERDVSAGRARRLFRLEQRVDADRPGEVLSCALARGLRAVSRDSHRLRLFGIARCRKEQAKQRRRCSKSLHVSPLHLMSSIVIFTEPGISRASTPKSILPMTMMPG